MNMDDNGEDAYMDLPDYQVFDPEKGPLEKRVQRSFLDAVNDDKVDLRDTEYWFSTPADGWNNKPQRVRFMPVEKTEWPFPYHSAQFEEGAEDRIRYTELEEGRVYLAMVTDVWLYHGVQVDIGAEIDGLIPCTEEQWELAVDHIDVGDTLLIEIHKKRQPGLYRWPLQAKFCERRLQDLMLHPDLYPAPVDWGWAQAQGMTMEEVAVATGRKVEIPTYFFPQDEQQLAEMTQDSYGTGDMPWRYEDMEPIEDYIDDPLPNPEDEALTETRVDEVDIAWDSLRM